MHRVQPVGGPLSAAHTPCVPSSPTACTRHPARGAQALVSQAQTCLQPSAARANDFGVHAAPALPVALGAGPGPAGVCGSGAGHAVRISARSSGEARRIARRYPRRRAAATPAGRRQTTTGGEGATCA